jgi:hypothetical protein
MWGRWPINSRITFSAMAAHNFTTAASGELEPVMTNRPFSARRSSMAARSGHTHANLVS